jgi:hypothetical protein
MQNIEEPMLRKMETSFKNWSDEVKIRSTKKHQEKFSFQDSERLLCH